MKPLEVTAQRQAAGTLLEDVLEERLEPRLALNRWPEALGDPSIAAAYHALWHFDADEERHGQELFYVDVQLELLGQMSRYLRQGEALPAHLLYPNLSVPRVYREESFLAHLQGQAMEAWQAFHHLVTSSLQLFPSKTKPLFQGKRGFEGNRVR